MVSAAVAYNALESEPQIVRKTLELLAQHPYYDRVWTTRLAPYVSDEREQYLFMEAACWPDEIRLNRQFHRGNWHYVNFPYKPKGQPRSVAVVQPAPENIISAFEENLRIVRDDRARPADRAIALSWLFHIVGDVHQPLHTTSYFTREWPKGDRGGNDFYIRAAEDRSVINLHSFWDDLVIGSTRYQSARNRATLLMSKHPPNTLHELRRRDVDSWADESFDLAKSHAYLGGKLPGSTVKADAPALTQEYRDSAKTVAERRIVLAGHRLARVLKSVFN